MKKLNAEDRMLIQACLIKNNTIMEIARRLKKNKSTISREISSHIEIHKGYEKHICTHSKEYFICNVRPHKYFCGYTKKYYNFEKANSEAEEVKTKSRSKSQLTKQEILSINDILLQEVRALKQSLHHVYMANPTIQKICSERTIRRGIYRGDYDVKAHELRRYVTFKHEYLKNPKCNLRNLSVIIGRTFKDYLNYTSKNKRLNVVQYDSVIGKLSDKKAILTVTFPRYEFQFGILIDKSNPRSVVAKIRKLFTNIGSGMVKKIFPINLADNGIEFSSFNEIEEMNGEKMCMTFFTSPYKATDKAECERYHEIVRYFIPKATSLDFLTDEKVNWMFSQINSMVRKNKGNATPYELVEREYGKEFLDTIGITKVEKKKINLNPIC